MPRKLAAPHEVAGHGETILPSPDSAASRELTLEPDDFRALK